MSPVQLFVPVVESYDAAKLLSCYAVFATSILSAVSFHCFPAHVKLEKELFAVWNQVPWLCKGKSKTITGYVYGLSNQEKNYAKNYTSLIPSHIRKTAAGFLRPI